MSEGLKAFHKQQYINLETFKRSGDCVKTPVWFVEDGGILYVRTGKNSPKVKRMRNFPHIRVAACSMSGAVKGEWLEATAEVLPASEDRRVDKLMSRKYGLMKWLFELGGRSQKLEMDSVAIHLS
jgi:uncharacterized protein